ncbi:hypothetical protein ACFL13_00450 [Patescibacteria group bacterium]
MPKNRDYLEITIHSKKETFFKGHAYTVTSTNDVGEFDVLPHHANFITLIKNYVIVDKNRQSEKKYELEKGVLAIKSDKVDVYLEL